MDSGGPNVPDLATVLKTLSAYTPAQSSRSAGGPSSDSPPSPHGSHSAADSAQRTSVTSISNHTPSPASFPASSSRDATNSPDPSIITAWPAALKCVMRTVAQNEALQSKIRRLIQTQHDHERQWWEGRETLLGKQKTRAEKKAKLDEVLRSVGGTVASSTEVTTPQDDLLEISNYDKKVYKALSQMSKSMDSELRGLGIPFFAIRRELVGSANDDQRSPRPSGEIQKAIISPGELESLQRRMLDLLEDLCKE